MPKLLTPPVFTEAEVSPLKPWYPTRQEQRKQEKRRARNRKADNRPFIAWDGEGITLHTSECRGWHPPLNYEPCRCPHNYTLLANSLGHHIVARDPSHPLTTQQCFKFILNTAAANPGVNHVWFSFSYDVNMMLGDVPQDELQLLYERDGQWTYLPSQKVHVQYRPKKTLSIKSKMRNVNTGRTQKMYVKMDDTFTFFQTSFVKACDTYLGKEWPDRELVLRGKEQRGTGFDTVDEIAYCHAELRALVSVMDELRSRLAYVDIRPRDWHGPGAIASKLLSSNGVKEHLSEPPTVIDLPLRHSYAGGRFELFRYGCTRDSTYRYDKRSAYPYAASLLPTAQGRWKRVSGSTEIRDTTLYRCEWHCSYADEQFPQPFHYRDSDGHVCYPPHVQGWYWGVEVRQALRLPYGQCTVHEGWQFNPDYDATPFSFLRELYTERRRLIALGHPAQLALKLAINSVYGKLIQMLGWSVDDEGEVKRPTYFSLFHASLITSTTRASLMELMIDNEGYADVISFETDAVFTSKRWGQVAISEELGDWEELELHNLAYLQSGVYATQQPSGEQDVSHVRGMTKIVWPKDPVGTFRKMIEERWTPYEYSLTAFVGLGTGLRTHMKDWRRWITIDRRLQTMEPSLGLVKRNHDPLACPCGDDDSNQVDIWHTTRVYPAVYAQGLQRAYDVEWNGEAREVFDPSELVGAEW